MFIAMNRFEVNAGMEEGFESVWRERNRYVQDVPGFLEFKLLRGATEDDVTTFVSHSVWASRETFEAWTQSEAFVKAHRDARSPKGTLVGHPRFEGYEVVLTE